MDPSFLFIILLAHFICLPPFSVAGFCATYQTRNITQFCDSQTFDGSDLYLDTYKASTRRTYCYCYFQSNTDTIITLSTKTYPSHTKISCKTISRIKYEIFHVPGTSGIICGYAVKQIDIRRGQSLYVAFHNELANLGNYCLSVKTATASHTLHGACFSDKSATADTSKNPATTSKQSTTKQRQEEAYTSVTTKNQGKNTTTTADSTTTVTTTDVTSPGDTTTSVTTTDVTSPGDTTTNDASKGYTTTDATSPGDTTTNGASKGYTTRGSTYTVGIPSGTLTGHTTSSASPGGTSRIGTTTGDATTIGTTTSVNVLQGTSSTHAGLPLTILIPLICVGLLFFIVVITVVAVCIRRRNKNKGNLKDENVKRDSDNGDEMVYNELYHTFCSNGGHASGDACAGAAVPVHAIELNTGGLGEYAEVSIQHTDTDNMKKIDENNCNGDQNKDCGPVYAMPDKTKKQDSEQGPIYAMPNKQEKNENVQDGATPIYAVPDKKKDK